MSDELTTSSASAGLAERVRVLLAVPVAFLASALGVVCVVSVPDVISTVNDLALVDRRFVGWAGVGIALGLAAAWASLLLVERVGAGPALSLGTAAAVFGLALAYAVTDPFQLTLALVLLGGAVGWLLAGSASMTFELTPRYRRAAMAAWALPVVSAWPLLAWISRHVDVITAADAPRLTVHPSVWLLAPVSVVIVAWSALTMLLEPPHSGVPSAQTWQSAWTALLAGTLGASLAVIALGFDPGLPLGWLRPLILFASGALIITLAALTMLLPVASVRVGYVCLVLVMVCFPITVQLLIVVTDAGKTRVAWWVALVLAAVTVLGAALGARYPRRVPLALLLVAAGCAGSWVMPDDQGFLAAGALPLCLGAGAVFGTGVRHTAATAVGWRFGAMAVVAIAVLGPVLGIAVSWALGGQVPADAESARAAGRVFLGVTFALAVLASAVVSVLAPPPVAEAPTALPGEAAAVLPGEAAAVLPGEAATALSGEVGSREPVTPDGAGLDTTKGGTGTPEPVPPSSGA